MSNKLREDIARPRLFSVWFDPYNVEHVKAWRFLEDEGYWPEDFKPNDVTMDTHWKVMCLVKLASAWVDHFFYKVHLHFKS